MDSVGSGNSFQIYYCFLSILLTRWYLEAHASVASWCLRNSSNWQLKTVLGIRCREESVTQLKQDVCVKIMSMGQTWACLTGRYRNLREFQCMNSCRYKQFWTPEQKHEFCPVPRGVVSDVSIVLLCLRMEELYLLFIGCNEWSLGNSFNPLSLLHRSQPYW